MADIARLWSVDSVVVIVEPIFETLDISAGHSGPSSKGQSIAVQAHLCK